MKISKKTKKSVSFSCPKDHSKSLIKSKNANKKRKNENFERQKKKCVSFSCPKDHATQKLDS